MLIQFDQTELDFFNKAVKMSEGELLPRLQMIWNLRQINLSKKILTTLTTKEFKE